MITIIDYGLGNLSSIKNMLKKLQIDSIITSELEQISNAEKLILPGVGSFDYGMEQLNKFKLIDVLNQKVLKEKTPILGICLGMQLFTKKSEEGKLPGLGWIDAETMKFNFNAMPEFKIPNMGWNTINIEKESKLIKDITSDSRFYFVHSYYVSCSNKNDILMRSNYGFDYTCAIENNNILGVQFHPEKSHKFGMAILNNFANNY
jgi:glutamine amidotransferase